MTEEIILEEVSPDGNVVAFVEATESCTYFYLQGTEGSAFTTKSCWVRNHCTATDKLNLSAMRAGDAPMLPRLHCKDPEGLPHFKRGQLRVIWAEEGDAAGLICDGELIAVIPGWSGCKGFHGYASGCVGQSSLCWELGAESVAFARYKQAERFWQIWEKEEPWPRLRDGFCAAYKRAFGEHSNYYTIDGGKWPPKALLRIPRGDASLLVTLGMSIRPQPQIEQYTDTPEKYRRVELGMALKNSIGEQAIHSMAEYIAAQSALPWKRFTFLGAGHTIPSEEVFELSNGGLSHVLITSSLGAPEVKLPKVFGDVANLLWMVPVSAAEQRFAAEYGSAALVARLEEAGILWISKLDRTCVI